jgi:hypothetical protein
MRKLAANLLRRAGFSKNKAAVDLKKTLADDSACYVLITCGSPSEDGKMQVEMTYQGDPVLAAYLVESAQQFIDIESP